MDKAAILMVMVLLFSCKPDAEPAQPEPSIYDKLGIEDYEQIVRHPVTLDTSEANGSWSKISFSEKEFTFDTVVSGEVIKKAFDFTNSGTKPLYILDTRVSCGCTVAEYNEGAIAPGESASIEIEFNTTGKTGFQNKSITVLSNSLPNEERLYIRGYVQTKK